MWQYLLTLLPFIYIPAAPWYLARIWVQDTPLRILWWPEGRIDAAPEQWEAPAGITDPPSDPAPTGKALGGWKAGPRDWRSGATLAVQLGDTILTVVTPDGFPLPFRCRAAALATDGIRIQVPAGMLAAITGPACLTFHTHPEVFTGTKLKHALRTP